MYCPPHAHHDYPMSHMNHMMPPPGFMPPWGYGCPPPPPPQWGHGDFSAGNSPTAPHAPHPLMSLGLNTPHKAMGMQPPYCSATKGTTPTRGYTPQTLMHPNAAPSPTVGGHTPSQEGRIVSRIERELHEGTKEDLVHLLMELSSHHKDVSSYVEAKAQIFALRNHGRGAVSAPMDDQSSMMTPVKPASPFVGDDSAAPSEDNTPEPKEKPQDENGEPCTPSRHTNTPAASERSLAAAVSMGMPTPPKERMPETRAFNEDTHPCIRIYGCCRFPASCRFAQAPSNLCIAFVMGGCPSGDSCRYVHRVPEDENLAHIFAAGTHRRTVE